MGDGDAHDRRAMNGPSREEFTAFTERLYETMDRGFQGVHSRMDTLNGRTLKGEIDRENLRTRLVSVEKELFRHPNRRRTDEGKGAEWANSLTKREGALLTAGLFLVGGMYKVIDLLGTKLWHVLMSSKP